MQPYYGILIAALLSLTPVVRGNIIFSQDFSTYPNGPISLYVSPTPDSSQWNSITSVGSGMNVDIANGALSFTRNNSGVGSFARTANFSPAPEAVMFSFRLELARPTAKATAAAVWQLGSDFSTTAAAETGSKVHSQFALNITDTSGGYKFRDLKTMTDSQGSTYAGQFPITWVVNNSATPVQYTAPNGKSQTLASDRWDLWCGPFPVFSDREATSPWQSITDIKFAFTGGSGTLKMDDFAISDLQAVPEPAATGAVAAGLLLAGALVKEWRRRHRPAARPNAAVQAGTQTPPADGGVQS